MGAQQNMRGSSRMESKRNSLVVILALITLTLLGFGLRGGAPIVQAQEASAVHGQSHEEAERKSAGCIICHSPMDEATMHPTRTVEIGCTDCHGGNSSASVVAGTPSNSAEYLAAKQKAHVASHDPVFRNRGAVPQAIFAKWLAESAEYVKFVNPGDLRVAAETCGAVGCHANETRAVSTSMMTHTGLLWGAALYNNGAIPTKNARFGESYDREGRP